MTVLASRAPVPPWHATAPARFCVALLGLLACVASLTLYALPLTKPILIVDDFQIVFRSWTWPAAWSNVWVPANEHAMPLGRISTAVLATVAAGRPTAFLTLTGWHGPLALVLGMVLVGLFVGRERGHPFYGLLAMALFGVSTVYQQAVYWYSASFSIWALDTFLLALLAAQQAVRKGRRWPLALSFLGCALAPGWFAIGILAGPLCSLYLLVAAVTARCQLQRDSTTGTRPSGSHSPFVVELIWSCVPFLGSLAFLAVSLPLTASTIMHLHHYGEETALEAFRPSIGLLYSCRAVVDHLAWGTIGVSEVVCPPPWVWGVFGVLAGLAALWTWFAPRKTLAIVGVGAIVLSYLLVYSARAEWKYESMVTWSRYHLFPQLGLVLLFTGGLRLPRGLFSTDAGPGLTWRQATIVLLLIGTLFVLQLPRGILAHVRMPKDDAYGEFISTLPGGRRVHWADAEIHAQQMRVLRRIEAVDQLCRLHHISAADARRVLDPVEMPYDASGDPQYENNWQFLHGSDDPRELTDEEIRRLLRPAYQE
jgi:hypothetical protein